MKENFQLFLQINEIESSENIDTAAQALYQNPDLNLFVFTNIGYVFENFQNLLKKEIQLEDFFSYGDITCNRYKFDDIHWIDAMFFVFEKTQQQNKYFENSLLVVDQIYYDYFVNKKWIESFETIKEKLNKVWSQIIIV